MYYKLLEESDFDLMKNFVDDENNVYRMDTLENFVKDKNSYGFIVRNEEKIIGFAFGYVLLKPDGKKSFYLHAIDIMKIYQNNGYGTGLMKFILEYVKKIGCYKMFLLTNKSNVSACKCYSNAGGNVIKDDDVLYVYDINDGDK